MRGVYVSRDVKKGDVISRKDVFFSIPVLEGQLTSGQWTEGMIAEKDFTKEDPIIV